MKIFQTKKAYLLLLCIIIYGALLRLFNFQNTFNMETDQAIVITIADQILNSNHLPLVGTITSFYKANILPPTYIYLITLSYYFLGSDIKVAYVFALFGIASILIFYLFVKNLFDSKTALLGAFLYSSSYTFIRYSRNFWQPHLQPFFVILSFFLLLFAVKSHKKIYFFLSIFFFFTSHMYVSTFLLFAPFLMALIFTAGKLYRKKNTRILIPVVSFLLLLFLVYTSVFLYELKNHTPSLPHLSQLISGKSDYMKYSPVSYLSSLKSHLLLFSRSLIPFRFSLEILLAGLIFSFYHFKRISRKKEAVGIIYFLLLPLFSLLLTGFYQKDPYPHRLSSVLPFGIVIFAWAARSLTGKKNKFVSAGLSLLLLLFFLIPNYRSAYYTLFTRETSANAKREQIAGYILEENTDSINLFVTDQVNDSNYFSIEYWYALEKISSRRYLVPNKKGNYFDISLFEDSQVLALICPYFNQSEKMKTKCREKLSEVGKDYEVKKEKYFGDTRVIILYSRKYAISKG